jgi:dihydroorotate dehydrogenase electron transfer subunit
VEIVSMRIAAEIIEQQPLAHSGPGMYWMKLQAPALAGAAAPGQFIMLAAEHTPYMLGRPFSIAGVHAAGIFILYKAVGAITEWLPGLPAGAKLTLWGPLGQGFKFGGPNMRLLLVGGGAGLAPLLFARQIFKTSTLLAGFSGGQFCDNLPHLLQARPNDAAWQAAGPHTPIESGSVYITSTAPDWEAGAGMVTDLLTNPANSAVIRQHDLILACGPWAMLQKVRNISREYAIPCQVAGESIMACGIGVCQGCAIPAAGGDYLYLCRQGPAMNAESIDWERLCSQI